jgi:hypothetical protein
MTRSKQLFLFIAVVFLLLLAYASYDISTKTAFPGSRPQLKERPQRGKSQEDSVVSDSLKTVK